MTMTLDEFVKMAKKAKRRFPRGSRVMKNQVGNLSVIGPDWVDPGKLSHSLTEDELPSWDQMVGWLNLENGEVEDVAWS